jgi:hypothetical protein
LGDAEDQNHETWNMAVQKNGSSTSLFYISLYTPKYVDHFALRFVQQFVPKNQQSPTRQSSNVGKHPKDRNEHTQNCTNVSVEGWIPFQFFQGFPDGFLDGLDDLKSRSGGSMMLIR